MGINLFNFENVDVNISNEIFSRIFIFIILMTIFVKFIILIINNFKLQKEEGNKVLIVKKYKIELLINSILYIFIIPILNYSIIFFISYIRVYITKKADLIFLYFVAIYINTIVDFILWIRVNNIINKYNYKIKRNITFASILVIFQYIINVVITIIYILGYNSIIYIVSQIWIQVLSLIILYYSFLILYYVFFNKTNYTYHCNKIQKIIDTSFYYSEIVKDEILTEDEFISKKDKLLLFNKEQKIVRTLNLSWIEEINLLRNDNKVQLKISKKQLENTILIYKKQKKRKLSFKKDKGHA